MTIDSKFVPSSSAKFTTTWNYSFRRRRRRENNDEILTRSRLRTDFHVTSSRRPPCRGRVAWLPITVTPPFLKSFVFQNVKNPASSRSSGLKGVYKELRFRGGLVWTVGLTWEIKLRFQISQA